MKFAPIDDENSNGLQLDDEICEKVCKITVGFSDVVMTTLP
jgi:hypothetical protein